MKQLILFLCLVAFLLPLKAQNNDRVKYIRDQYTEAQNKIKGITEYGEEAAFKNYTTMTRYQNWSAVGPCHYTSQYYYEEVYEDETEPYPSSYAIVMVRNSFSVADHEVYEEYLYDSDGTPLFFFKSYYDFDVDAKTELRAYYGKDGKVVKTICKKAGDDGKMKETEMQPSFQEKIDYAATGFTYFKKIFDDTYNTGYDYYW